MVYRIRYVKTAQGRSDEVRLEANSPQEAIIKFNHIVSPWQTTVQAALRVTSIIAEGEPFATPIH